MEVFKRVLVYFKSVKVFIVGALICSILFAFFNLVTIWLSATFVENIFSKQETTVEKQKVDADKVDTSKIDTEKIKKIDLLKENFNLNKSIKRTTRKIIERDSKIDTLKIVCIFIFCAFLLKNIFFYLKNIFIVRLNYRIVNSLRNNLYEHLQKLSLSFYDRFKAGEISSIAINDIRVLSHVMIKGLGDLIVSPIQIFLFGIALFIISWKLTLFVLIILPVMALLISEIGKSIKRKSHRTYKQTAVFISILQETVSVLRIVKAFATEKFEIKRFKEATKKYYRLIVRQKSLQKLTSPLNEILGVTTAIALLLYGGSQVLLGRGLAPEDFIRFIVILFSSFQPLKKLTVVFSDFQSGLAAAERIFRIIDIKPEIYNAPDAGMLHSFNHSIEIDHVWFSYNDESYVLKDIDLTIKKGEIVAFVGLSGAGKSTLVDLIPRFYDVSKGKITIDSIDIRKIKNIPLKKLFGMVAQEPILFNNTIRYNISYGSNNVQEKEIINAAKVANAHDFIIEMKKGYDTIVGDRGVMLSGGQKQRVAIARAVVMNPPILILDEATSSLDTESERLVQGAIDNLMKKRTTLVIAHRFSTIIHADKIVVLHNGEVVDFGPHKELLKRCEIYQKLYKMQFNDGDIDFI